MTSMSSHAAGKEHAAVVVALGVAVHRLIDRHPVDPEGEIRRVVGAEAADRRVGREAGALPLLVDLEAGGLPDEVPGVGCWR